MIKTLADNLALTRVISSIEGPNDRRMYWLGCSDSAKESDWRWLDDTPVGPPGSSVGVTVNLIA
jgi:hypothetical protein